MTLPNSTTSRLSALIPAACLGTLLAFSLPTFADPVQIPVGQQAGAPGVGTTPSNGMAKHQVQEQFGEPRQTRAAVGDPPISSWEYSDYVVYFEGDKVLHSVRKHRPLQEADASANGG